MNWYSLILLFALIGSQLLNIFPFFCCKQKQNLSQREKKTNIRLHHLIHFMSHLYLFFFSVVLNFICLLLFCRSLTSTGGLGALQYVYFCDLVFPLSSPPVPAHRSAVPSFVFTHSKSHVPRAPDSIEKENVSPSY